MRELTTANMRYEYINGNCEDHPSDAECPTAMRWDVWIKAHDAEVAKAAKVEALREAAERLSDDPDDWMYEVGAKVWLLARADHIEAGEGA